VAGGGQGVTTWSEGKIARAIALQTLAKRCVVLVDRCNWTGYECDVLGVTPDLRIIDVEIKISRSDFKADAKKDKWWHRQGFLSGGKPQEHTHRPWPPRVWKHYIAMPAELWDAALFEFMPSPKSGLLLVSETGHSDSISVKCERRSTPNKDADRLTPAQAVNVARLANLRMWDAYAHSGRLEVAA